MKKRQKTQAGEERRGREKKKKMMMKTTDTNSHYKHGATDSREEVLCMYGVVSDVGEGLIMRLWKCCFIIQASL